MAFWINIHGCQPYPRHGHLSKCKSAQKSKLLLGTEQFFLNKSIGCEKGQALIFVVSFSYGPSTHPATPDSKLVSTQGRPKGCLKVWKSGVVGGIICNPPPSTGWVRLTDLPKSGGACTPPPFRHPCTIGKTSKAVMGSPEKKPLSHFCPLLRLEPFVSKGFFLQHNTFAKGQLISECLFYVLNFPKKTTKNLTNFCPRI